MREGISKKIGKSERKISDSEIIMSSLHLSGLGVKPRTSPSNSLMTAAVFSPLFTCSLDEHLKYLRRIIKCKSQQTVEGSSGIWGHYCSESLPWERLLSASVGRTLLLLIAVNWDLSKSSERWWLIGDGRTEGFSVFLSSAVN